VGLLPFLLPALMAVSPLGMAVFLREGETAGGETGPVELAQMTIEQRVIIRVPMTRRDLPQPDRRDPAWREAPPPPPVIEWEERKGPKCINISRVRAAAVTSSRGVDLMLKNRGRMRALLGRECRSADFYSGFYIQPNPDGALCAGRDRMLARSGADCEITALKLLEPRQ